MSSSNNNHNSTNSNNTPSDSKHIEQCVRDNLQSYFRDLGGEPPSGLYDMLVHLVDNNQSRAAEWLGLNRNTLRKKLLEHKLL